MAAQQAQENYKRSHGIYALETQRAAILQERAAAEERAGTIRSDSLTHKIAEYDHQLDIWDKEERELGALQSDTELAQSSYALYSHKYDEARAYENVAHERADSVRIIQPPMVPNQPRRLQPLIMLLGLFLGMLMTLAVAALSEFHRRGFDTPEQLEFLLGLPVLAVIPYHGRKA